MKNRPINEKISTKKPFKNKWFITTLIGILAIACITVLVNNSNKNKHINNIKIEIKSLPNNINFLTQEGILAIIKPMTDSSNFKKAKCEQIIEENPYVKRAEVYQDLANNLHIKIIQREPIVRVVNKKQQQYYLDAEGNKFKVVPSTSARVLVANGQITEELLPNDSIYTNNLRTIYDISLFINNAVFWKQFIEQIYVDKKSDILLIPKVGSFTIVVGDNSRLEEKFNDLEIFVKEVLPKVGWEKYKTVNVKFKGQIVTTKNE